MIYGRERAWRLVRLAATLILFFTCVSLAKPTLASADEGHACRHEFLEKCAKPLAEYIKGIPSGDDAATPDEPLRSGVESVYLVMVGEQRTERERRPYTGDLAWKASATVGAVALLGLIVRLVLRRLRLKKESGRWAETASLAALAIVAAGLFLVLQQDRVSGMQREFEALNRAAGRFLRIPPPATLQGSDKSPCKRLQ